MRLKSCPFCGSNEVNNTSDPIFNEEIECNSWVCPDCICAGPVGRNLKEANLLWNKRREGSTPKIIFLDIDGVLNCQISYEDRHEGRPHDLIPAGPWSGVLSKRCIELLNSLTDQTGAKLVISSVWRSDGLENITQTLKTAGVTGEVIGITGKSSGGQVRGNEIESWIKDNEPIVGAYYNFKSYIILDDDSDMLYCQRNNYFQVDAYAGLTPNLVYRARNFLNGEIG